MTQQFTKPINFVRESSQLDSPSIDNSEEPSTNAAFPKLNYSPPQWASPPFSPFSFEVIKQGVSSNSKNFSSSFIAIGRLPVCDISLEHQSISRYHAVVQCKTDGSKYIYDLGSTHGTYLNKQLIEKNQFNRIRAGDMLRFGASSRLFVMVSNDDIDQQPIKLINIEEKDKNSKIPPSVRDEVSWGFGEEAYEGDEWVGKDLVLGSIDRSTIDPLSFYLKDPRKVLTDWMKARGEDLIFSTQEEDDSEETNYLSRIELPIETGSGQLIAIGSGTSKKKSERDACIEACAKLDKLEILRGDGSNRKSNQKRIRELFGDINEDMEDDFYDRTKQSKNSCFILDRKDKKIKNDFETLEDDAQKNEIQTLHTLKEKKSSILAEIADLEAQILNEDNRLKFNPTEIDDDDDLEAFMSTLNKDIVKATKESLETKKIVLEAELQNVEMLIKIAAPSMNFDSLSNNLEGTAVLKIPSEPSKSASSKQDNLTQRSTVNIRDTLSADNTESFRNKVKKAGGDVVYGPYKDEAAIEKQAKYFEDEIVDSFVGESFSSDQKKNELAKLASKLGY